MKKYYTGEMIQFGNTLMITLFSFVISFTLDNIKRCQFLQTKQFLHGLLPKFLFCYKLQLFFGTPISILLLFIFFFDKRLSQFIPPLTINITLYLQTYSSSGQYSVHTHFVMINYTTTWTQPTQKYFEIIAEKNKYKYHIDCIVLHKR